MSVAQNLRRARRLIASGERWCHHAIARDQFGRKIAPVSARACQWCAIGSIRHTIPVNLSREIGLLMDAARKLYPGSTHGIIGVNDHIGLDAVLACYDWAIDQAMARGL